MTQPLNLRLPLELAYRRRGLFAIELRDPVTLARVSQGIHVVANGLRRSATVNTSGLFVWLEEDLEPLQSVSVVPGRLLPYARKEVSKADLRLPPSHHPPITTIELSPRVDYPFTPGITGLRGTVVEERAFATPVPEAEVRFSWLDEDGTTWRDAPTVSQTDGRGDFAAMVRFGPGEAPAVGVGRTLTLRLRVRRDPAVRSSANLSLPQGRVVDPTTSLPWIFAWDEMQP